MSNQMCIIGAGTHLGAGVRSAFVFPSATLAQAFTLTFIGNAALRKGPQRFWLHCHNCHCTLTFRYQNSPWWWSSETCNNFWSSFWLPSLAQLKVWSSRVMHVDWNELQTSHLHNTGSLWTRLEYELVDAEYAQVFT